MDKMLNNSITRKLDNWKNTNAFTIKLNPISRAIYSLRLSLARLFPTIFSIKSRNSSGNGKFNSLKGAHASDTMKSNATIASINTAGKQQRSPQQNHAHSNVSTMQRRSMLRTATNATIHRPASASETAKHGWKEIAWQEVNVGDLILIKDDENVPADVVVLSTSEGDGTCYIETKNLDGETNLKVRQGLKETHSLRTAEQFSRVRLFLDSEPPLTNLYVYNGALILVADNVPADKLEQVIESGNYLEESYPGISTVPVNISNTLLRGSVLRNTEWVIALVVFTGSDTKVMLNSGKTPSKRSRIDILMNPQVIMNFIILAALCSITAIINAVYTTHWRELSADNKFAVPFINFTESSAISAFYTFL
jgi:phospholipid-translocating ATPase